MPTTDDAIAPASDSASTAATPQRTLTVEVFRYHPDAAGDDAATAEPTFQSYEVPFQKDWVVLDALNWIKDWKDGTLSYRWSCRMGVCGSCGMMLNGVPKLACSTFCNDYYPGKLRIEPLANFPVERDVIVTLDGFMEKLTSVKPYIIRDDTTDISQGEYRQTPAQLAKFKQFTMCINCTLCYAACPQVGAEPEFLGPAVIALAHRYNLDSRDQGKAERMSVLSADAGAWECTLVGECSTACPKHVDPAAAVQQVKIESAKDWFKKVLIPWGQR